MKNGIDPVSPSLRAAIAFDVQALKASDDGRLFLEALQLQPGMGSGLELQDRMPKLRRLAYGLTQELAGDPAAARTQYTKVASQGGAAGLLGLLLIAWMEGASEGDFDAAESAVQAIESDSQLVAHVHTKLLTWSIDKGWTNRALHHFDLALQSATGDLERVLGGLGDWVDRAVEVRWGAFTDPLVTLSDVTAQAARGAESALDDQFKESLRSPWTRTILFGTPGSHRDLYAAEMQAHWAGALWLLPEIRRRLAAVTLPAERDPASVARGVALWVRGGGQSADKLIDAYEALFVQDTAREIVDTHLHRGASTRRRSDWVAVCTALWDQIPSDLVKEWIEGFTPAELPFHPQDAAEMSLFSMLALRDPAAWADHVLKAPTHVAAGVARMIPRAALVSLSNRVREHLLTTTLSEQTALPRDWQDHGWVSVAAIWASLPGDGRKQFNQTLWSSAPPGALPRMTHAVGSLAPRSLLLAARAALSSTVEVELASAKQGRFTGWAYNPAIDLAFTMVALEHATTRGVRALVQLASSSAASTEQSQGALSALTYLAEQGLVGLADVEQATVPRKGSGRGFGGTNPADVRLEGQRRLSLAVRLDASNHGDMRAHLLAGTRDPDARVREIAIASAAWVASRGAADSAIDACLFGGLYDPVTRVQSLAASAVLQYGLTGTSLREVASHRLRELLETAHRDVRAAIAHAAASAQATSPDSRQLLLAAMSDRSFIVRYEASVSHPKL